MLKSVFKIVVFVLVCFCFIELSYRFVASGFAAFHPVRFNSMNVILNSGLVQQSEFDEIGYELKPDLDTWFQGVRLRTNSFGMADREYPLEKPADTTRIAVAGSSWTMATGVEPEDAYHAVLESRLAEAGREDIEFLNFSVEFYGLKEIIGTLRHRVGEFQPDAVVVGVTTFTAYLVWDEEAAPVQIPEQTYPFFQSYALRELDRVFGLGWYDPAVDKRPSFGKDDKAAFRAQLVRFLEELRVIVPDRDVPIYVVWLAFGQPGEDVLTLLRTEGERLDIEIVEGYKAVNVEGKNMRAIQISRFNKHPNKVGHARIAAKLAESMVANGTLPDTLTFEKTDLQVD